MFGNRLGWGISAVLTVLVLLVLWQLAKLTTISPPSQGMISVSQKVSLNLAQHPELLEPIKLPADPSAVVTMTDPTDAAAFYRDAIACYDRDKWTYEPNSKTGLLKSERIEDLPAITAILQATHCATSTLFSSNPAPVIDYQTHPEPIEKLQRVGNACKLLATSKKADRDKAVREKRTADAEALKAEAMKYFEASFSLGHKMVAERVRWPEFDAGWELMVTSALGMERLDPSRSTAKSFADACTAYYRENVKPLWVAIGSVDPGIVGRTAGDVFYIAKNSKERMWRVEAVLKLGRYRHDAGEGGRGGDQKGAGVTVKRMADDPKEDPIVRLAAQRARDLTLEQYRQFH
jgi:hypothetical protein